MLLAERLCTLLVLTARHCSFTMYIDVTFNLHFSSTDACFGLLAFGLYRTRHFAVGATLRPRTIGCERVKAADPVTHRQFR